MMLGGCVTLIAGAAVTFASIQTGTPAVLFVGTAAAGIGAWFMNFAHGWTFSNAVCKVFFDLTIAGLSAAGHACCRDD